MFKIVTSANAKPYAASTNLMQFRRVTSRYGRKGTFSGNHGYMRVRRDPATGKFAKA